VLEEVCKAKPEFGVFVDHYRKVYSKTLDMLVSGPTTKKDRAGSLKELIEAEDRAQA